jgi:hypothetical protein
MLPTWKCVVCGKKFTVGEWTCQDGTSNHTVEMKEYLMDDAPSDPGHPAQGGMDSLRDGRTRVCNMPPDKKVVLNGEVTIIPGGYVEFVRGRYSTDNPEIQYLLDKKGGFCTPERWAQVWLSQGQQFELERQRLSALSARLENERNELLNQTKQRVANG